MLEKTFRAYTQRRYNFLFYFSAIYQCIDKNEMRKFLAHLNKRFYKQLEMKASSEAKKAK